MANPYFTSNANFGKSTPNYPIGESPYAQQQVGTIGQDQQFGQVQQSFYGPAATARQTGRMTIDDVIVKSALVIGTVVLAAIASWQLVPASMAMPVLWGGLILGLVLGLVNAFKKEPSPALIMGYAVAEGVFLGLISRVYAANWEGIVMQAIIATFITFAVCFVLFKTRIVKVTGKFAKIAVYATIAYAAFCMINLGVMVFAPGAFGPWGLRSGLMGLLIGAIAVVLASMNLIMDFDQIERGVRNGVDRKYAWSAAFGLTVTLVWLYLEFLRLLAILNRN
ncbi:hypothetical protein GCG21_01565 [Pseudactinotalea sp. HY160]|nr:hypothetical protein [Pseudactinotalea sp. HY160]QGH70921.1 hypothetical protein GCE65_03745 [Pseudactinotalea sp. HY158]